MMEEHLLLRLQNKLPHADFYITNNNCLCRLLSRKTTGGFILEFEDDCHTAFLMIGHLSPPSSSRWIHISKIAPADPV